MITRINLIIILAVITTLSVITHHTYGQTSISGQVIDSQTKESVIGANIYLESDTSQGTTTDANGTFQFNLNLNDILVISSLGYVTSKMTYTGQKSIQIELISDTKALEEIVIIGYGVVEKKDATGSISSLSSENFNQGNQGSTQDLIVGKIAGVQITPSAEPGGEARIRIRGGASLSASNKPLFVIDGVIFSDEKISGLGNPLSLINPNDIENITILKDASATAIYGSRASNGVILVTTKKGSADGELSITLNSKVSINTLSNKINVLSGDEFRALLKTQVENGTISSDIFDNGIVDENGTTNTDWQNEIYRVGSSQDHNVSLTGNIKAIKMPVRASIAYFDQNGVVKTSTYKRYSTSLGLNPTYFENHLKVNLNARYSRNESRFVDKVAINEAIQFDPTKPVFDSNSPFGGYYYWPANRANPTGTPHPLATVNPLARIMLKNDGAIVNNFNGNAQFDYKFHFFPQLRANLNLATVRSSTDGNKIESKEASWTFQNTDSGTLKGLHDKYSSIRNNDLLELYFNYVSDKTILGGKIDVMAGYSWQKFFREDNNHIRFIEPDTLDKEFINSSENYLVSFYGRLNYNLFKKYLFTFTLRRDGSSRFVGDNQWGLFPAAAFAWRVKDEGFLKNVSVISDLKVRLGYGVTGQENISDNFYPALGRAVNGDIRTRYTFGTTPITTTRLEGFDSNLKWETTTTYNLGVDFELFKGKLSGTVDLYQRNTEDLLNTIPVPVGSNFTNELLTNVGSLQNTGFEASLQGVVLSQGDHELVLGANITHNKNEVTKLTLVDDPNYLGVRTEGFDGATGLNAQIHSVGFPINTFFLYQQIYDQNGKPIPGSYVDQNNDGIINDQDLVRSHSANPDWFGGINGHYSYKQWSIAFNGRVSFNNYVYDNISSQYGRYENLFVGGTSANAISNITDTDFRTGEYLSDYYLHNASFFRMDNISLGYNFGNVFREKLFIQASFVLQNAFVITNYKGLDPEIATGIDNKVYPRARVYTFGVTINFK